MDYYSPDGFIRYNYIPSSEELDDLQRQEDEAMENNDEDDEE